MFKFIIVIFAVIATTLARPSAIVAPFAYNTLPYAVAAGPAVVTATSSQYQARNHNAFAAPIIAAQPVISSYAYSNSWDLPYAANNGAFVF